MHLSNPSRHACDVCVHGVLHSFKGKIWAAVLYKSVEVSVKMVTLNKEGLVSSEGARCRRVEFEQCGI